MILSVVFQMFLGYALQKRNDVYVGICFVDRSVRKSAHSLGISPSFLSLVIAPWSNSKLMTALAISLSVGGFFLFSGRLNIFGMPHCDCT